MLNKFEATKISFWGYLGRGSIILFIVSFMILGLVVLSDKIPDANLYTAERLNEEVSEQLIEKNIISDASSLLYLNPKALLSFMEAGSVILKDGIVSYSTTEDGQSRSIKFKFKEIVKFKIDIKSVMLGMQTLTIYIYDEENDLVFFDIMIPKSTKAEDLKEELMSLWKSARDES